MPINPLRAEAFRQLQIEAGIIPNLSDGPFSAFLKPFEEIANFFKPLPGRKDYVGGYKSGAFIFSGAINLPRIQLRVEPANIIDYFSATLAYGSEAAVRSRSVRFGVLLPQTYAEVLASHPLEKVQQNPLEAEDYGFYLMSPPSEMQTSFESNTSIQEGRKQSIANYMGKDLATASFSGNTRAWYLRNIGLSHPFRDQSHSYRNFMEFLTFFLMNGRVLHGSEGALNLSAPTTEDRGHDIYDRRIHCVAVGQMDAAAVYPIAMEKARTSAWVRLTVGHIDVLGKFKSLRYSQEGPNNFAYSFEMDIVDLAYNVGGSRDWWSERPDLFLNRGTTSTSEGKSSGLSLIPRQKADCISRDFFVLINGKDMGIDVRNLGNTKLSTAPKGVGGAVGGDLSVPQQSLNKAINAQRKAYTDNVSEDFIQAVGGDDAYQKMLTAMFPRVPLMNFPSGGLIAQKLPSENPNYQFVKSNLFSTTSLNSRLTSYNVDISLEESSFNMGFALTDIEAFAFMKFQSLPVKLFSEFELWETGRFMVKAQDVTNGAEDFTTPYYRRFWGIISSRGLQKTSGGSNAFSLKGTSMMYFLQSSEFPIGVSVDGTAAQLFWCGTKPQTRFDAAGNPITVAAPAPGTQQAANTTPTGTQQQVQPLDWGKMNLQSFQSANMNIFELVMFALDRTLKYAILPTTVPIVGDMGTGDAGKRGAADYLARKQAEWDSERGTISTWWNNRLRKAIEGFRIYGIRDVVQNIMHTTPRRDATMAVGYTQATLDVQYLSMFCPKWVDAVNNTFMDQEKITAYDYIKGLTAGLGMEFYADVDGSIVMKFPFYNLNVFDYQPFNIELVDVVDWTYEDNMDNVKTFVEVKGHVKPGGDNSMFGANAFYIDKRLADVFGLQGVSIEVPMARNSYSAELFAMNYADLMNLSAYTFRLTIKARPELRVGFPIYVKHLDMIGYVSAISRSGAIGSNADMDVTLTALRFRVYDANGQIMAFALAKEDIQEPTTTSPPGFSYYRQRVNVLVMDGSLTRNFMEAYFDKVTQAAWDALATEPNLVETTEGEFTIRMIGGVGSRTVKVPRIPTTESSAFTKAASTANASNLDNGLPQPFKGEEAKGMGNIYTYSNYPYFRGYTIQWKSLDSGNLIVANAAKEYDPTVKESQDMKYFSAFRSIDGSSSAQPAINYFPLTDAHGFNLVGGMPYGRGLKLQPDGRLVYSGNFKYRAPIVNAAGALVLDSHGKPTYPATDPDVMEGQEFTLSNFSDLLAKAGDNSDSGMKIRVRTMSALTGRLTGNTIQGDKNLGLNNPY